VCGFHAALMAPLNSQRKSLWQQTLKIWQNFGRVFGRSAVYSGQFWTMKDAYLQRNLVMPV
jgi:hypothetical protein